MQSITYHCQQLSLREGQSSSCSAVNHIPLPTAVLEQSSPCSAINHTTLPMAVHEQSSSCCAVNHMALPMAVLEQSSSCSAINHMALPMAVLEGNSSCSAITWYYKWLSLREGQRPRFQARSKDQEIKRREVELDLEVGPEEIMSQSQDTGNGCL